MSEQRNRREEIRHTGNAAYHESGEQQAGDLNDWPRPERESERALLLGAFGGFFDPSDYAKADRSSGSGTPKREEISNERDGLAKPVDRLLRFAERELSAFFAAVKENFGAAQAGKSAFDWLEELKLMDWPLEEETPNWRQATLSACAHLSALSPEKFGSARLQLKKGPW